MIRLFLTMYLSACCFALRADITGDGRVDLQDLAILADEWLLEEDSMYGDNLVVNGGFDINEYWSDYGGGGAWTIAGGKASADGGTSTFRQEVGVSSGKTYRVEFDAEYTSGNILVQLGASDPISVTESGHYIEDIVLSADPGGVDYIELVVQGAGVGTIDNITIREKYSSVALTNNYTPYRRFINRTGKKIQFRMSGTYSLRSFSIFGIHPQKVR